jgi:putative holliday junction resolvase
VGSVILGIDYGRARVGLAYADADGSRPQRLTTLSNDEYLIGQLQALVIARQIGKIIVGLPRGVEGAETAQTALIREFVRTLEATVAVPVGVQDEFATTAVAKQRLASRKPLPAGQRGLVDQEAAVIILEDHLAGQ